MSGVLAIGLCQVVEIEETFCSILQVHFLLSFSFYTYYSLYFHFSIMFSGNETNAILFSVYNVYCYFILQCVIFVSRLPYKQLNVSNGLVIL